MISFYNCVVYSINCSQLCLLGLLKESITVFKICGWNSSLSCRVFCYVILVFFNSSFSYSIWITNYTFSKMSLNLLFLPDFILEYFSLSILFSPDSITFCNLKLTLSFVSWSMSLSNCSVAANSISFFFKLPNSDIYHP